VNRISLSKKETDIYYLLKNFEKRRNASGLHECVLMACICVYHRNLILLETISRLPYIYELCSSLVAGGDLCRANFVLVSNKLGWAGR
jgi:adenosyl cobinamide kinase/adenosyl cobinamide phosphate guanylyltransferase